MTGLQQRAALAGVLMKLSYVATLVAITLTTWVWVQEGRQPSLTIYAIRILPLAIFCSAVFRAQLRGLAWLCFVALGYFVPAVTNAMSPRVLWIDYVHLGLVVLLFCSAMMFIRWQSRAWKVQLSPADQHAEEQQP